MSGELAAVWDELERLKLAVAELQAEREGTPRERAKQLLQHAHLEFEERDRAQEWLLRPNAAVGGKSPLEAALESREGYSLAVGILLKRRGRVRALDRECDELLGQLDGVAMGGGEPRTSPYDVLNAWAEERISAEDAMHRLHLGCLGELVAVAMDSGHRIPPSVLPQLREALDLRAGQPMDPNLQTLLDALKLS